MSFRTMKLSLTGFSLSRINPSVPLILLLLVFSLPDTSLLSTSLSKNQKHLADYKVMVDESISTERIEHHLHENY